MQDGISLIICTYNGMDKLSQPLHAIINQNTQIDWELVIIDNASTDATVPFCTKILEQSTISWRIVAEKTPGLNHARLRGLKEAIYDIILFCDDDNSLDTNYLENGFRIFENHPKVGAVGGCGSPSFKGVKPEWFDQYSYSFAVGEQANQDGILQEYPAELYGAGTFFRKAPLLQLFNKNFKTIMTDRMGKTLVSGGDVEWCYLIQLLGYQLYYDHRLTFLHEMPENRMQWEYYLRLKAGIASGVCRLLSYHCLFEYPKSGALYFIQKWLKSRHQANVLSNLGL
jgi:glycosyltransferase involved in cell wall biosynthesis